MPTSLSCAPVRGNDTTTILHERIMMMRRVLAVTPPLLLLLLLAFGLLLLLTLLFDCRGIDDSWQVGFRRLSCALQQVGAEVLWPLPLECQ